MSYRTYINDTQVFGNNEYYPEWIKYIQSKGIEVDDDGGYDGEITDFMEALEIIEKITLRLSKERDARNERNKQESSTLCNKPVGLFDLSNIPKDIENDKYEYFKVSLFDKLIEITKNGYAFMPYAFYEACKDKLQTTKKKTTGHLYCYQLKENEKIKISAG